MLATFLLRGGVGLLLMGLLTSCPAGPQHSLLDEDIDSSNSEAFQRQMMRNQARLGPLFHLRETGFDVECIYGPQDLTELALQLTAELAQLPAVCVREELDEQAREFVTVVQIEGRQYQFRTSAESDWAELEKIMPVLAQIARELRPAYQFEVLNPPYDQTAEVVYGRRTDLLRAVARGYPCSLPDGHWDYDKWPARLYTDVHVARLPPFDTLRRHYQRNLQRLHQAGYRVPNLTLPRLYFTDLLKSGHIDICIDGQEMVASEQVLPGPTVRCSDEGWGVLLAYTLTRDFHGEPTLLDRETNTRQPILRADYLRRAEAAFGRRQPDPPSN
ncbi:hypothetical protein EJV47_26025 [Hymenobacter gummosus]|uniref:Uncharacterized protein n=1 Tax=Hymenobacter gummosus TaxID=1776032 RepID=A0A3S0JAE9_9BACT|nr:hypothetical protein [Hymenobacter gummosus]RTQ45331.1 hypothetical protein EJV47_26025 [Hymenobacter gummosus]